MKEQIATLFLIFNVTKTESGWQLKHTDTKRAFPTVFCRQLDYMERVGNTLVCTSDTPDGDDHQMVSIDLSSKRKDGIN